jgi:hypothetical protein
MKTSGTVLLDEQRWEQIDAAGSGPAVLLRNVRNQQCGDDRGVGLLARVDVGRHVGVHPADVQGGDLDAPAARRELLAHHVRLRPRGRLRGAVRALVRDVKPGQDGQHVDDGAAAIGRQDRRESARHRERAEVAGLQADPVEIAVRQPGVRGDAGAVDEQRRIGGRLRAAPATDAGSVTSSWRRLRGRHGLESGLQTGAFLRQTTQQGWRDDSSWARGQGWAIHGFGTAYRFTGEPDFLQTAVDCADFYIARTGDRLIPPNDWEEPDPALPCESSAAAIAADGLWQLACLLADEPARAHRYAGYALRILVRLCSDDFLAADDPAWEGVLRHGSYHEAKGLGVDESVMWGDYFFLDAIETVSAGLDLRGSADQSHLAVPARAGERGIS